MMRFNVLSPRISIFFTSILLFELVGCTSLTGDRGIFRGRDQDYLKTGSIKPISLPEGMTSASLEPLMAIPMTTATDEFGNIYNLEEYQVPRPNPLSSGQDAVGVKIQKLGGNRWIYLNVFTGQVWPRTQNFLSENNIPVTMSDAATGVIETGWIYFKDDTSTKSKYRILLEKGIHPETTEVHVRHNQVLASEPSSGPLTWPANSVDSKKEASLLEELAAVLAENINNSSASLLGQNVGGEVKAQFVKGLKEPTIRLRLPMERASATVAHALKQEGFALWERDSARGVMYVGYLETSGEEPGFWRKMAFWRGEEKTVAEKSKYSLDHILAHLHDSAQVRGKFEGVSGVAFGDRLADSEGFLVRLTEKGEFIDLVIRNSHGEEIPVAEAKQMLRVIRKNLI